MRHSHLVVVAACALAGCATNLPAVRDFADETRRIGVAFDPVLGRAVEQCQQQFLQRRIYTTAAPLGTFDPQAAIEQAAEACKPIGDENATAKRLSQALSDYAGQLSALAADGVASSVDDDYDALAAKLTAFKDVPPDKVGAIASLLKFVTRTVIARSQHDAIVDALSHEMAVGALADALVVYSERVYRAYVTERLRDQPLFVDELRAETAAPISSRLRLMDVYRQTLLLQEQQRAAGSLRIAVDQMKVTMSDLRRNVDRLSSAERRVEVKKLAKEVRSLYRQLAAAF